MTLLSEILPLSGKTVLVTRAREQSGELVEGLGSLGAAVQVIPALAMEPEADGADIAQELDDPQGYDHLVFTSVNGVEFFLKFLENDGRDPAFLPPALCVGSKTAQAWERAGGKVELVPEKYTAHGLLDLLPGDLSGRRFLLLRPREVSTPLGELMEARGGVVTGIVLYRTVVPEGGAARLREALEAGLDAVTFASPSAVRGIITLGARSHESGARKLLDIPAVCIGPTTAEAARGAGFRDVHFPDEHTAGGMIELVTQLLANG